MNCQEVMELMQRHLDEDLDTQEEMELQDHLRHCQECTEMFERLQRLSQELTQLPKVVPPYSLVDALIPQLGEIDKAAAQTTTESLTARGTTQSTIQQHTINKDEGQRPHRKWTRRLESQFSWKFASGVIAAGLIIGFFAFNMKHPVLDNADGLLPPKASKEIASTSAAQQGPAADEAGAANVKRVAPSDSPQTPAAVTAPAADQQQPAAGGSAQSPASSQGASDATVEKPQPLKAADDSTPTPKIAPSTSEPARMKSPGASEKAATEAAPNPTAPAVPSPTPEPQVSESPQAARIQATEPPATSPVAGPKEPRAKSSNTNNVFSLMSQVPAPLKSLTGTYEAVIENHHVVVRDSASQEVVYTSTYQGQESDEITLGEWSKDDTLTYQVKASNAVKSFVIDVKKKTESST